jgi:hypothetical protein
MNRNEAKPTMGDSFSSGLEIGKNVSISVKAGKIRGTNKKNLKKLEEYHPKV